MTESSFTSPQSRGKVIDTYFLEHRAKLLDIAAYLDRIDRARPDEASADFRDTAFRLAIAILSDGETQRAKRILDLLSDHSSDVPQSAEGMKGASGAPRSMAAAGGAL